MNVIFVGSTVDRETLKSLPDASVAGNKMELGFIKGLMQNGVDTIPISVEAHGMWKLNNKPIFIPKKELRDGDVSIHTVPYINVPGIKQLSIMHNLRKQLKDCLKEKTGDNTLIIVYNTMTIFVEPVLRIGRKMNLKTAAIIADLPIQEPKNIFRRVEDKRQIDAIKKFDALIPLTDHIANDFAPGIPCCTIEAGVSPEDYKNKASEDSSDNKYRIVFSGTLNNLSGIELILDAMEYIQSERIELNIYGDGPLRKMVQTEASNKSNVVYCGKVSNEEMMAIQGRAKLLVCPRKSDTFTTRYTFPSKVLEYICSGVPVLSNRLDGIPSEYERYISFAESESPETWAQCIEMILSEQNYKAYSAKAIEAREIVLKTKSWKSQTSRAIRMFSNI